MPFDYSYDPATGVIAIVASGSVTLQERYVLVNRLLNDSRVPDQSAVLIDARGAVDTLSETEVPVVAELIRRLQTRFAGRVALLSTNTGHVTTSHLVAFSAYDPDSVVAFVSETDAREWLGRRPRSTGGMNTEASRSSR